MEFCPKCKAALIKSNLKVIGNNYYCVKCNTPVPITPIVKVVKKFKPKPGVEFETEEAKVAMQQYHDEQMKQHFVIKGELAKCWDRTEFDYTKKRDELAKKYGWGAVKKVEEELIKERGKPKFKISSGEVEEIEKLKKRVEKIGKSERMPIEYPKTGEFFQRVAKEAGYEGWGRGKEYVCRKCGHVWKAEK